MPKQQYTTPILAPNLDEQITDAIQAFLHRGTWREWGLDRVREQGAAILLYGPPGTGKTITAMYIARKLHLATVDVNMAEYGSHIPGELARNIRNIFGNTVIRAQTHKQQVPMIFMDECDSMIIDRKRLDAHSLWMLEPVNALLREIEKYPGLIVLSTNLESLLDSALDRRLLAKIYIGKPAIEERRKIWLAKWPEKFPIQLSEKQASRLATAELTGAEIENAFLLWAGKQIRQQNSEPPDIDTLIEDVSNL